MSRYTKAQRHGYYKAAKEELIASYVFFSPLSRGICSVLLEVAPLAYERDDFPEFESHRPLKHGVYWWPRDEEGYQKRLEVLDDCIEKTKP